MKKSVAVQSKRKTRSDVKIMDLDVLVSQVKALKLKGKTIVHCHGVFDLLHVGHIRHFEEAKAMGDVLVVTITPDRYVNKGPHRPAFHESLRAEVIASLDVVDIVAINRWPTSVETIKCLRPDIYVKGPDYKDASKDVTGGIRQEQEAVKFVKGKIQFTQDITFSSSNLLNRHLSLYSNEVKGFLDELKKKFSVDQIIGQLDQLRNLKVLVVGEAILDEYVYGNVIGKSSKEPILALQFLSKDVHAGGALAIANHVSEFCDRVDLVTYLGSQNTREEFVRSSLKSNVHPIIVYKSDSPTIVKRRFVDKYMVTKLLEIYEMNDAFLSKKEDEEFCRILKKRLPEYDVVIVADFDHGLISSEGVKMLSAKAHFLAVNAQVNAANIGFHTISKYKRADYICVHEGEIRLEHRDRQGDLKKMIDEISRKLMCQAVMVTRGRNGTAFYQRGKGFFNCPPFATKVVDRIGAGDAVLSVTSLCACRHVPPELIGFIGNLAGAQAVTIVGNSASISKVGMVKTIESLLK